jgi:hypothetical protein
MAERVISEAELLLEIDTGDTKYKDDSHLWVAKHLDGRTDNLVCAVLVLETAVVVKTVMHHFLWKDHRMRTTYYDEDDILVIHLSEKPIVKESSQDWNTHISYAADGTPVEIVVLDANASGALPIEVMHGKAA